VKLAPEKWIALIRDAHEGYITWEEFEQNVQQSYYGLETRYSRLRLRGMLTLREIATRLDISPATTKTWRRARLLRSHRYNDKGETLFEQPGPDTPIKYQYQHKNRVKSTPSAVARNSLNS
jgi:hypothetical protein